MAVIERLLHAVADAVEIVFGLDQGQRNIRLVIKDVVGPLRLAARHQLAAHNDAGERMATRSIY